MDESIKNVKFYTWAIQIPYTMDGNLLEEVSEEKDLGVIIDKQLKFHSHTALVVNKANRMLGLIRHCSLSLLLIIYIMHLFPQS